MSDWNEKMNGNFVTIDNGQVTTVFRNNEGHWQGIRDGEITERAFDTPEEAMEAIDEEEVSFIRMKERVDDTGWRTSKSGGLYRRAYGRMATVRQAKSGKWFVMINGSMITDQWLDTALEATRVADRLMY